MEGAKRFLLPPGVIEMVGMARDTIHKLASAGIFPAPVQLGLRVVAWEEITIATWQDVLATGVKTSAA